MTKLYIGLFSSNGEGGYDELDHIASVQPGIIGGNWQEFCFEIPAGRNFDAIRIQPNHPGIYYVDDIRLSDEAPVIPEIQAFSVDFEEDQDYGNAWASYNSSSGDVVYRSEVNEYPFNNDPQGNTSEWCMRAWITQGTWDKYGGVVYKNIFGVTTEDSRYLHVRFFFLSSETEGEHADHQSLPLRVFVNGSDVSFNSEVLPCNKWHDVTIDLGVGTLVQFLNFNIDDWWVTTGFDDIQLDGNPDERELLTGINNNKNSDIFINGVLDKIIVNGITEQTTIEIYNLQGILVKQMVVTNSTEIPLNKGMYIVNAKNTKGNTSQKVIVNKK